MTDLLLRDARLWGREGRTDLLVSDGRIAAVGDALAAGDAHVEDLAGAVVIPGLVDAHAHVDKTLWGGPWVPRTAGPGLAAAIAYGADRRAEFGIPNPDFITALLTNMAASGTTHARSHVDVDPGIGTGAVDAVLEGVERLAGRIDVELVAFPQTGILVSPGTADLLEEALKAGVKSIGGIDPAGFDLDAETHLDLVFALAGRYGAEIDIHLHDGGDLGIREFDLIIERTRALGYTGKVVISHAFALCDADDATRARLIADLAELQIGLTSVAPKQILPLRELAEAGVTMGIGNDGVRDLWSPYGTGDLLQRTQWFTRNAGFSRDADIELALHAATFGGARLLKLDGYGLAVGDTADLVALKGRNPSEAVLEHHPRPLVVKNGRITARDGKLV
ncbi:amidohydrolase family protein [Glycomyces scopariae]|uniref:Cytosine deaminase n=1 Tax=Glycomyces sambucus TaxID=380244 RepID=A0A1G9LMS8_9ACTN|nr:amidohydrolase [Glycomyces sambucus]SDL63097.1 cytosine deaminase [Glycomyces sambucus]